MTDAPARTRILCVDDEPYVLDGLSLHLRRRYEVLTAVSGAAGLEILEREADVAVVLSDMRMPGMDGATFLARARHARPHTVRMLLTGQADLASAIAAVNDGQLFRFLTKPCPTPTLLAAVDAAAEQHRLLTAERVLLEQTLHGSIKTLADILALTNPAAFGRATRIKQLVTELATALTLPKRWQVEVAAMLSQLGCVTLPTETAEKLYYGRPLSAQEQTMVNRLPAVTEQLLGNIPRLEEVRTILATYPRPFAPTGAAAPDSDQTLLRRSAHLLRVAIDFDTLESQGTPGEVAVNTLRSRPAHYDPEILAALLHLRGATEAPEEIAELALSALRTGMVFAEDVTMTSGMLLVTRGYEITESFIERVRNFRPGTVKEPVRVIVSRGAQQAA